MFSFQQQQARSDPVGTLEANRPTRSRRDADEGRTKAAEGFVLIQKQGRHQSHLPGFTTKKKHKARF